MYTSFSLCSKNPIQLLLPFLPSSSSSSLPPFSPFSSSSSSSSSSFLPLFFFLFSSSSSFLPLFFLLLLFSLPFPSFLPLPFPPLLPSPFSPIPMIRRRSVTASLLPSTGDDHRRHSHHQQQTITVVENIRHRQQRDDDDRRTDASAQLEKTKEKSRWSDILGGWGTNGKEGRSESDGDSAEELIAALKSLQSTGKMAAKSAEAQTKGATALAKWARKGKNETTADLVGRISELMEMHAERQRTFAKDYGHYLKQLQKVAETERKMRAKYRKVEKLTEKEKQMAKMLAKKGDDNFEMRQKLARLQRDREWAERETEEEREENEFARMAHLEAALKGMADVQLNLAHAAQLIFTCQNELTASATKRVTPTESEGQTARQRQSDGGGVSQTRQKVTELRRSLDTGEMQLAYNAPSSVERRQRLRRSEPPPVTGGCPRLVDRFRPNFAINSTANHPFDSPPPPYTPSAPPFELLDSSTRSSNTNRHSVGGGEGQTQVTTRIYPQLPPNPFAEELKLIGQRRKGRPTISVE